MDKTDIKILKILQSDAGQGVNEIAAAVNLSTSSCWRRINRLQNRGVIKRNVALLDRKSLGIDVVVFVMLSLVSQTGSALQTFEDTVSAFPEVVSCYTVTGQMDYMLKIVVRDMAAYERFLRDRLSQVPNVREVHSHVGVTRIKDTMALPLDTQVALDA